MGMKVSLIPARDGYKRDPGNEAGMKFERKNIAINTGQTEIQVDKSGGGY